MLAERQRLRKEGLLLYLDMYFCVLIQRNSSVEPSVFGNILQTEHLLWSYFCCMLCRSDRTSVDQTESVNFRNLADS